LQEREPKKRGGEKKLPLVVVAMKEKTKTGDCCNGHTHENK